MTKTLDADEILQQAARCNGKTATRSSRTDISFRMPIALDETVAGKVSRT